MSSLHDFNKSLSIRGRIKVHARILRYLLGFGEKNQSSTSSHWMIFGAPFVGVCLVVGLVVLGPFSFFNSVDIVNAVEEAHNSLNEKKETAVLHVQRIISEGKDKAAYISEKNNLPIEEVETVPLRRDLIHSWETGVQVFGIVEHDLPNVPGVAYLKVSDGSHVHVLDYKAQDCGTENLLPRPTEGCTTQEVMSAETQAHRKLFDSVHNLSDMYNFLYSNGIDTVTSLYFDPDTSGGVVAVDGVEYYLLTTHPKENIVVKHYVSTETLLPTKDIVYIIDGEKTYEMAVVDYEIIEWLEKGEKQEYFDLNAYPYEQRYLVPLT